MSRVTRSLLLLASAVAIVAGAATLASGGDEPRTLDDRVRDIASELRCPVCQNLSVADSPSRLAGEMRSEIAARLGDGATDDEVRAFFVERYGEWVLLAPTRSGLNLLPWLVPLVGAVVGAAAWWSFVRRRPPPQEEPA